jgi:DNA-binding MarR family transcriptional regulator
VAAGVAPEEFRAYAALIASSTLLQRAVEQNLREQADLTQVQFEILMNLANVGRAGLRMAQLADALIVSRSGLSYQVAQLEARGWITRQRSADDERGIVARITAEGERMRARVFAGHVEVVRRGFLDVVSPRELTTLTAALERVADRLR